MNCTHLRKVGAHVASGLVSGPWISFYWLLQAEETHLSAGAESTGKWTANPQCPFGPPCPLWGCLLAEAAGKDWRPVSFFLLLGTSRYPGDRKGIRWYKVSLPLKGRRPNNKASVVLPLWGQKRFEGRIRYALVSGCTWEKMKAEQGTS